ncbi:HalOD1 output domain-containing protein [Halostella litorea]|uniref:HalOD1 output domain-containing protein n=1 Tax=Halostella litorea TaxID=2528831 RepID=UPI001091FC92|nr:HalOD1 output domain-containing protein [Halostella litorea]
MVDHQESAIVREELETDRENPAVEIAEIIADMEDKDHGDLTTIYSCIDHMIDHIFSEPPAPEAQLKVEFSYEGYRITVEQDGHAEFVKTT